MKKIDNLKFIVMAVFTAMVTLSFTACSDDDDEPANKEYDSSLFGEWVEDSDNSYVFDYYCFYSDGTGIHGSYESDIDLVNEEDDITWYTVDDEYLYINGRRYRYSCSGSSLDIEMNGRTRHYYER